MSVLDQNYFLNLSFVTESLDATKAIVNTVEDDIIIVRKLVQQRLQRRNDLEELVKLLQHDNELLMTRVNALVEGNEQIQQINEEETSRVIEQCNITVKEKDRILSQAKELETYCIQVEQTLQSTRDHASSLEQENSLLRKENERMQKGMEQLTEENQIAQKKLIHYKTSYEQQQHQVLSGSGQYRSAGTNESGGDIDDENSRSELEHGLPLQASFDDNPQEEEDINNGYNQFFGRSTPSPSTFQPMLARKGSIHHESIHHDYIIPQSIEAAILTITVHEDDNDASNKDENNGAQLQSASSGEMSPIVYNSLFTHQQSSSNNSSISKMVMQPSASNTANKAISHSNHHLEENESSRMDDNDFDDPSSYKIVVDQYSSQQPFINHQSPTSRYYATRELISPHDDDDEDEDGVGEEAAGDNRQQQQQQQEEKYEYDYEEEDDDDYGLQIHNNSSQKSMQSVSPFKMLETIHEHSDNNNERYAGNGQEEEEDEGRHDTSIAYYHQHHHQQQLQSQEEINYDSIQLSDLLEYDV